MKKYSHDEAEEQKKDNDKYCTCMEPQPYADFCAWCGGELKDGNEQRTS